MLNRMIYQNCIFSLLALGMVACSQEQFSEMSADENATFQTASKDDYEPVTGKKLTGGSEK